MYGLTTTQRHLRPLRRAARSARWSLHLDRAVGHAVRSRSLCCWPSTSIVHHRLAPYAAVNIWGYRGEVLGRKQPNEKRIVMIGPSTVFSVGFPPEQSLPAHLERFLQQRVSYPVHVVNLGMPGEDAFAYRANLEDFRFLKPDAVIFYGDSNPTGDSRTGRDCGTTRRSSG